MEFKEPNPETSLPITEKPKTLAESLPFLQVDEQEERYNSEVIRATKLMTEGKIDEVMAMAQNMRGKQPQRREFTEDQIKAFQEAREQIVRSLGYTIESNDGKWLMLSKDGMIIQLKHFMTPGASGYNGGRISGVIIGTKSDYFSGMQWDDGEMVKASKDIEIEAMFNELVHYLN